MRDSAKEFASKYALQFSKRLGEGKDGVVLSTDRNTAVKFFNDADIYSRELHAYRVLKGENIDEICGHHIPQLRNFDDSLRAIEMTIVTPPFLLDFAAAYTEEEVEYFAFDDDVVAEREIHWAEVFGERWPDVVEMRRLFLERTGLVLLDLSLNNIRFA